MLVKVKNNWSKSTLSFCIALKSLFLLAPHIMLLRKEVFATIFLNVETFESEVICAIERSVFCVTSFKKSLLK